jgi:hypothetical protein
MHFSKYRAVRLEVEFGDLFFYYLNNKLDSDYNCIIPPVFNMERQKEDTPVFNMETQKEDERKFYQLSLKTFKDHKDADDADYRMRCALDMTFMMLQKLHICFTSSEREARYEEDNHDKFRINWSEFFEDIDVISNITHNFTTDKETGFVTAHKLENVDRHEMAETMIAHLKMTIHNLKRSTYQHTFERWLVDLLDCWHYV